MTVRSLCRAAPAVLLAVALAAAPALAQTDTTPPAAGQAAAAKPAAPAATARDRMETARVEQHIKELHRRLKITPAQQSQWDVFAQTMRDNATHMDQLFRARSDNDGMNAVDDLKSYAGIAEAHAQDMQRLVPVFETLYGAMAPDQQKVADAAFKEFEARGMRRPPHG